MKIIFNEYTKKGYQPTIIGYMDDDMYIEAYNKCFMGTSDSTSD